VENDTTLSMGCAVENIHQHQRRAWHQLIFCHHLFNSLQSWHWRL
jgi:hypothetical protein